MLRNKMLNTLQICENAQKALTERSPKVVPSGLREYTEMSSVEEYRKFQNMNPITPEEIAGVNWSELTDKLKDV